MLWALQTLSVFASLSHLSQRERQVPTSLRSATSHEGRGKGWARGMVRVDGDLAVGSFSPARLCRWAKKEGRDESPALILIRDSPG